MPKRPRRRRFEYPPLIDGQRSIRLLTLSGVITRNDTAISCRLKSFSLPSCPSYRALSYTWGSPFPADDDPSGIEDWRTPFHVMSCNGKPFYIRQNLKDALQNLVQRNMTGIYWIDSICINQQDDQERAAQVSMMGDIFTGAVEVVCWLGRGDAHCEGFLELHHRLALLMQNSDAEGRVQIGPTDIDAICCDQTSKAYAWSTGDFTTTEDLCASYIKFLQRTWFNRLWVAQEVALAQKLRVFLGEYEVDWDSVGHLATRAANTSFNALWTTFYQLNLSSKNTGVAAVLALTRLRLAQSSESLWSCFVMTDQLILFKEWGYVMLLETLRATIGFQSTDVRDRIYGILGMISKLPLLQAPPLQVNYTITPQALFIQIASVLVLEMPYLSLLGAGTISRLRFEEPLPSWVPNFASESVTRYAMSQQAHGAGIRPFGRSERKVETNRLIIYGHLLGAIKSVHDSDDYLEAMSFLTTAYTLSPLQPRIVATFCRTILRTAENTGSQFSEHMRSWFHAYLLTRMRNLEAQELSVLLANIQYLREAGHGCDLPSQQDVEIWSNAEMFNLLERTEVEDIWHLSSVFRSHCIGMDFAFLDCGTFIGSMLEERKGDQVWIIEGAKSPIILRPVPNSSEFTLVGEAYLDGLMFGEALRPGGFAESAESIVHVTII